LNVSVVIPAINEARYIQRAITSALEAAACEVVVVDGGSLDETVGIARQAGATVIASAPGRAVQQNAGAGLASGDVLLFLHADSALGSDCLAQIQRSGMQRPLGAFQQRIDAGGWMYRVIERGNAWRAARWGLAYGDQAIFIERDFFFALGQFPHVPIMEDYLLMKQARRQQHPVVLEGPVLTNARRWQKNGVLRQTLCNWSMVLAAMAGASPQRLARFYPRHDADCERPLPESTAGVA
jgi:rSAM/selenodomain-associated transferase 2